MSAIPATAVALPASPFPRPFLERGTVGVWPRTSRLLPWGVAAFAVMLWLAPFDAMQLPISLPVDSKLDRFALGGMVLMSLLVLLTRRGPWALPARRSPVGIVLGTWLFLIAMTVVVNAPALARLGEVTAAIRALSLALSFAALFGITVSVLRPTEIRPLMDFNLALACLMALGLLVQYRTGVNYFYRLANLIPGMQVNGVPISREGTRQAITGPTGHGLAACTVLGMLLPYAILSALDAPERRRRLLYAAAATLLTIGAVATVRKTAVIIPLTGLLVIVAYRPRAIIGLLPMVLITVAIIQVVAPGAISGIRYQFSEGGSNSTEGRTEDYGAVAPDVKSHLLLGRGYGTYSAQKYRYLDNQILALTITTGVVGVLTYLALFASAALVAHRLARRARAPGHATIGVAVVAGLAAYLVSNVLFDTLAFRHVPYLALLLAGFVVVLYRAGDGSPDLARSRS